MENINISFAPDTSAVGEKRISDIENYLALLSERIRFCFENIGEEQAAKKAGGEDNELILSALSDGVGEFTNADKTCEIFNDYSENRAQAYYSHAEGSKTSATAPYSHAEGYKTVARELASHSEGVDSIASGQAAHAEGECCEAGGRGSHAGGYHTKAYDTGMCSVGRCNKTVYNALFVVGNGVVRGEKEYPSDALVVDNAGNLHIAGRMLADGGVDMDLSEYLRSDEIADWAKSATKPVYTASEVGAAAESHNHTVSDITDMPDWAKSAVKPEYTSQEVGAAAESHNHTVSDITDMPDWAKADRKPEYTAQEVGAATLSDITAALDGLVIGGQNLLRNTYDCAGWIYNSGATVKQTDSEGYTVMTFISSHDTGRSIRPQPNIPYSMIRNKKITVSFEVKSDGEYETSNDGYMFLRLADSTGSYITRTPSLYTVTNTSANWEKASFCVYISDSLFSIPTSQTETDFDSALTAALDFVHPAGITHSLSLRKFKLELGDKATDWSIANADIAEHFARLSAPKTAILSGGEG